MRLLILIVYFLFSCRSEKFQVTEDYVYNSNGFSQGFTIQRLKVNSFDNNGIPKDYNEDTLRVDLEPSSGIKKVWFNKPTNNCFWVKNLNFKERFNKIPIDFETNKWYVLWSNDFNSGTYRTNRHVFFIYTDINNNRKIYEKVRSLNL